MIQIRRQELIGPSTNTYRRLLPVGIVQLFLREFRIAWPHESFSLTQLIYQIVSASIMTCLC